jgi:hypothetical protein
MNTEAVLRSACLLIARMVMIEEGFPSRGGLLGHIRHFTFLSLGIRPLHFTPISGTHALPPALIPFKATPLDIQPR